MQIIPTGTLVWDNISAVFPRVISPAVQITDYMANLSFSNTGDLQGLKIDHQAVCAYTMPVFVPHNQRFGAGYYGDANLPTLLFDTLNVDADTKVAQAVVTPWGNEEFVLTHAAESEKDAAVYAHATLDGTSNPAAQGIMFLFKRTVSSQAADEASDLAFHVEIGDHHFSVATGVGIVPAIGYSSDGGNSWNIIRPDFRPDSDPAGVMGNTSDRYIAIEFLLMNYQVQINIGGGTTPYVTRLDPSTIHGNPVFTGLAVDGVHFTELHLSAHLIKWSKEGWIVSNPIDLGFSPAVDPTYTVHGLTGARHMASGDVWPVAFPPGSKIKIERPGTIPPTAQNQQYLLTITNPKAGTYRGADWSDLTAAVTRAAIKTAGVWQGTGQSTAESLNPKEIEETITFDPNGMTVHHTLSFLLDNFHAQRRGLQGQRAVRLALGYMEPNVLPVTRFTGLATKYAYQTPGFSRATVRVFCVDQMQQLRESYIMSPPDLDGWNHYSAMAFLAQCAGIHASQMAFAAYVPTISGGTLASDPNGIIDPYSAVDPDPYFLPFGAGMMPWTPKNREMPVLDLMNYIRQPTGFLLFFDAPGYLRYEKWVPPTAAAVKKTFGAVSGPDGANLTEFWDFSATVDMEPVQNVISVIGIDAYGNSGWSPVVTRREDTASISDPTAINYKGYRAPFVWADSRFFNLDFANKAADALFAVKRLPEYSVGFETFMQPTLFPMDTIAVQEGKSGADTLPFYIMQMTTRYLISGSGHIRFRSQINGRYITPF